ncbi:hypothetical protein NDU88_007440 [Pleurodeles waltl]|uniref:Uncharacterized protein n=1 Tax=Pleurodeles waltl TaxID=8319 RepID=A0AAV7QM51_PLEWA|nr:hypothetical protein NDU88_007440 [Pleurodeles waltl]
MTGSTAYNLLRGVGSILKGKDCMKFGKKGHFARMCKTMSNKYSVGVVRNDSVCDEGRDRVLALGDSGASHSDKPPRPTGVDMLYAHANGIVIARSVMTITFRRADGIREEAVGRDG